MTKPIYIFATLKLNKAKNKTPRTNNELSEKLRNEYKFYVNVIEIYIFVCFSSSSIVQLNDRSFFGIQSSLQFDCIFSFRHLFRTFLNCFYFGLVNKMTNS